MLTITHATYSHGYTGADHMLDTTAIQGLIGRRFRSAAEARRAAIAIERKYPQDRRCSGAPIYLEALVDGTSETVVVMGGN